MFLKLATMNLISNNLLVAQDLWEEKEARNSVKVAQALYGWHHLHLPATGAKVSTMGQAYSQVVSHGVSLMYSVLCFQTFLLTWACSKAKTKVNANKLLTLS